MSDIRIGRYLALTGACSRREAAEFLKEHQVVHAGKRIVAPNYHLSETDSIEINGKRVEPQTGKKVILLNKPAGYICSHKEHKGEKSIFRLLPDEMNRYFYAGRLDVESRGLVVLSNDGDLIFRLSHPKFKTPKRYMVRLSRPISPEEMEKTTQGIWDRGERLKADKILKGKKPALYEVILHEGKNREIRRIFGSLRVKVTDLCRTHLGPYALDDIVESEYKTVNIALPKQK